VKPLILSLLSAASAKKAKSVPARLMVRLFSSENNHEETKTTKKEQKKVFVVFVSSWLIFILSGHEGASENRQDLQDFSELISIHKIL